MVVVDKTRNMDTINDIEYVDPYTLYRDSGRDERFLHLERYDGYYIAEWDTVTPSLTIRQLINEGRPPHRGLLTLLIALRLSVLVLSDTFHRLEGKMYDVSWETRGGSVYITLVAQTSDYSVLKYLYKVTTGEEMEDWWYTEAKSYLGNLQGKSVDPEEEMYEDDELYY